MSEPKIAYHLNFSDIIRVLRLVDDTHFREVELELEGLKVRIVQDKDELVPVQHTAAKAAASEPVHAASHAPSPSPASAASAPAKPWKPAREHVAAAAVSTTSEETTGTPVVAPLAGTFYRAPLPGAPPFIEVGSVVRQGDVIGILEIMKLMNHVPAPCSGIIREICARNEEFVEFGQVLAIIEPERGP